MISYLEGTVDEVGERQKITSYEVIQKLNEIIEKINEIEHSLDKIKGGENGTSIG